MKRIDKKKQQIARLKGTIDRLQKEIETIQWEDKEVRKLAKRIGAYLGTEEVNGRERVKIPKDYKTFFYRLGLESGISYFTLQEYVKDKTDRTSIAVQSKRNLIRRCSKYPQIQRKWEEIKNFVSTPNH